MNFKVPEKIYYLLLEHKSFQDYKYDIMYSAVKTGQMNILFTFGPHLYWHM